LIEFEISTTDDPEFINIVKKIIIGNIIVSSQKKIFIVKVDNWFNHKWLGYAGGYHHLGLNHTPPEDVALPPFSENRMESKNYYEFNENSEDHMKLEPPKDIPPYDIQIPEASRRIRKNFPGVGFFWYSGNTATNNKGSLMGYVWTDDLK